MVIAISMMGAKDVGPASRRLGTNSLYLFNTSSKPSQNLSSG
uniref:Uncharacterized protein n=1 Tax=Rhizophora mucronata TaxID=61149 RepID=A0A2P2KTN7_RHIMU